MPTYSVGVVDFVNESGVQGDLLARLATDAVVVEMSKTNRYDVSITRTMMKQKMEELGLRPPLPKIDLVRLGEVLSADAMLEGVIKSVQLAGSGPTRRASVTLVLQMVDQASGEIINGAVQTGTSSARVGYTADDNALVAEAINSAAFLCVKTMVDYVIPEATVMMNVGGSQVMINKGVRDGIKPGMRMIVLRDKEIIGYLDVTSTTPDDAYAKVVKSMRGIQPQDKARAIFEMPMVSSSLKSEPLPSGAPKRSGMSGGAASKIGKFLLSAAIVFGVASIFQGGSGSPDAPIPGIRNPLTISWDPKLYNHGQNVYELQVLRDQDSGDLGAIPVRTVRDHGQWNAGFTNLNNLYGPTATPPSVNYYEMPLGSSSPASKQYAIAGEDYGITHTYNLRALLSEKTGVDDDGKATYKYTWTQLGSSVKMTAVEQVRKSSSYRAHIMEPIDGDPLIVAELSRGETNFTWTAALGADQVRVVMEPVQPNTGPKWTSSIIYPGAEGELQLSDDDRLAVAAALSNPLYVGKYMRWRVDGRHMGDTLIEKDPEKSWTQGEWSTFKIGGTPPGHD